MSQNISLVANNLPGHLNTVADRESRVLLDRWDWQLHPKIFLKINQIWGPLTIDLFASRLKHQLPAYFSWRPDPRASATDAFLQDWSGKICYANPPWGLMLKVLSKKINHQQADVIIVAPVWKGQSWFPVLLSLPFDFPHLVLLSTCPILSQHSMPPCSSFRMYNWPHGPPQGILPNEKVFRTSFRTSHCILTTRVHQILQFTLSQVKVLVFSMEWKSYFRSCSGNLKFLAKLYQEGYSYGSLNLYRFIISSVHEHIEGFPIG